MANLGNVGYYFQSASGNLGGRGFYTVDKQPTPVEMTAKSDIPFAYALLTRNAVLNYRTRCDGSGNWYFYDMDDSGSQNYSIITVTQGNPTGEEWKATVVGTVVVVTKLFGAQRALAAAFA